MSLAAGEAAARGVRRGSREESGTALKMAGGSERYPGLPFGLAGPLRAERRRGSLLPEAQFSFFALFLSSRRSPALELRRGVRSLPRLRGARPSGLPFSAGASGAARTSGKTADASLLELWSDARAPVLKGRVVGVAQFRDNGLRAAREYRASCRIRGHFRVAQQIRSAVNWNVSPAQGRTCGGGPFL